MTNKQVARALKRTADLIELTGGNAFRARAYASAARAVDGLREPVAALAAEGRLTEVPGVGSGVRADVEALLAHGASDTLEALYETLPPGLPDVLRVQGLGPKRVRTLWQELGVESLVDLEAAALAGRIAALPGFGKKTEERLLAAALRVQSYLTQRHYYAAVTLAEPVLATLRATPGIVRAEAAGDLRRRSETVDRVEIVVQGDAEAVRAALAALAPPDGVPPDGAAFTGRLPDGLPLLAYRAEPQDFGRTLWTRTGSEAHLAAFSERYGAPEEAASEDEVYARAGLLPIPPELREGEGELDAAEAGTLPRLITVDDLRGSLHNHSTYSDGAHSLREMAEAARRMGYGYFAICDHSRSLKIANGLSIERLREQGEEVRALNEAFTSDGGPDFRVFHGSEVDILQDGSLDYPDDVLAELDFVVASVHVGFEMTEAEATARIVRAVESPYVDVLGHPTGRLLLRREGYPVDHSTVIEACAPTASLSSSTPTPTGSTWTGGTSGRLRRRAS
jgi:DNA polymerase (family X)